MVDFKNSRSEDKLFGRKLQEEMKTTKQIRERLREMRATISKGQWGILGNWYRDNAPKPNKGPFEIAPGLSIGAVGNFDT